MVKDGDRGQAAGKRVTTREATVTVKAVREIKTARPGLLHAGHIVPEMTRVVPD